MDLPRFDLQSRRPATSAEFQLRCPLATDGRAVHALIADCPPLDTNSLYLNLLQCTHFAETSVLAECANGKSIAGFVSGYLLPQRPDTLFIWQVAIASDVRGQGLGKRMLLDVLERPACAGVCRLETTIGLSNRASWALFRSIAKATEAPLAHRTFFDRDAHLDGVHESEELVTIGPFAARARSSTRHN